MQCEDVHSIRFRAFYLISFFAYILRLDKVQNSFFPHIPRTIVSLNSASGPIPEALHMTSTYYINLQQPYSCSMLELLFDLSLSTRRWSKRIIRINRHAQLPVQRHHAGRDRSSDSD